MKRITEEYIRTFNPCDLGINNYVKHYSDFNGTMSDFLALDHISYSDKIWLAVKVIDYKILQQWSVECAENVLGNYESAYSNDSRVRNCIETTKKYLVGECSLEELKAAAELAELAESAARSAARSAAESARSAAARSAAESARSAAELAESAARSAAESAARSAVWSAAWSARSDQETINLSLLIALL